MSISLLQAKENNIITYEPVQYLIGDAPSWMLRYGIGIIAAFFVLLLSLSYIVKYPDLLDGKVVLTTSNPPIRVISPSGGRIVQLLVHDQQAVQTGEILAVMENAASWQDVLRLEAWLKNFPEQRHLPASLKLGSLQTAYSEFSQHWKDYHYFTGNRNYETRAAALRNQIGQLQKINDNLMQQNVLLKAEFLLTGKEKDRQARLHSDKVISDSAFEKAETAWLQQKRQIEAAEATILQTQMQMQQLESQIAELGMTRSDMTNQKDLTLAEDVQRLQSTIVAWKQNFLIVAPISGKISFSSVWSVQQSVTAGAEILAIVPDQSDKIIGKSTIPAASLGTIKPGCRAIVYLDAWPASQYGSLEGRLANISALPESGEYRIDVQMSDSLVTSYGETIPFRQEMPGTVRVVTEERRIIARMFDRLNDLLKNR